MKGQKTIFCLFVLLIWVFNTRIAISQEGLKINTSEAAEGYVLMKQSGGFGSGELATMYLINNCGELLNTWTGMVQYYSSVKLQPNGNIVYFNGNTIYEKNWDDVLLNEVELSSSLVSLDYEVIKKENGNYLSIGRRRTLSDQFDELGFTSEEGFPEVVDVIIEVDSLSGEIIWEWNISDHIIQERDSTKMTYGVVEDHPELLDIAAISSYDWAFFESFMINGFDYNPELEQVMVSIRKMSEIAIIDQSTTTQEASGHTGGRYGKGGDILFRWGNLANYSKDDSLNRELYFQHNPTWITDGPLQGKLSVFNNGLSRDFMGGTRFSDAPIVDTQVDAEGNYQLDSNGLFSSGPAFHYYRPALEEDYFISSYLSGVELMFNGNAYFTVGEVSELIEVNAEGEIVWKYTMPFNEDSYRTEKYPHDYPAFANRDLSPIGEVPNTIPLADCMIFSSSDPLVDLDKVTIVHDQYEVIEVRNPKELNLYYTLIDSQGKIYKKLKSSQERELLSLSQMQPGFYILQVINPESGGFKNHKFILTQH